MIRTTAIGTTDGIGFNRRERMNAIEFESLRHRKRSLSTFRSIGSGCCVESSAVAQFGSDIAFSACTMKALIGLGVCVCVWSCSGNDINHVSVAVGGQTSTAGGQTSTTGGTANSAGSRAVGGSSTSSLSSEPTVGATMADVQAIFTQHCVTCHDASKLGLPAFPGLPLTEGAAYAALVNRPASESCGGTLVVPGQPDQSYLMQKLTNDAPCSGAHMPRPFESGIVVPLTADEIATIRSWIVAGAKP